MKDQTNAQTLAGTDVTAEKLSLEAGSDYALVGASAAVAASGSTAVAVNGMVTILKAATLAELGGNAKATGGAVDVNAHSKRDVINVAATVAASGQTGAGITVMALIAGDEMNQDAADQLTYGSGGKDSGKKAFDASGMLTTLKGMGIKTDSMKEMPDDLEGDGERMDAHVGSNGSFDVASGYTSDGIYTGGNGENAKADETNDVKNAKNIGASARTANPLDSVTARISSGATVDANDVSVEAKQETLADLFGASVGVGGQIGGGLSFAVALLRSNVIAASLGDIDVHGGDVKVNAVSQSGEAKITAGSDEELRMTGAIKALGDKLNPTKRSIRAIGVAVGVGGMVGAGIAAGAVRTDNITSSTLGGSVKNAGKVTVNSDHKYRDVLAATVGLAGGGEAGIAASIAGVAANGTVSARLDGGASITGDKPNVSVTTDSIVNADTVALAGAIGGGAGIAAGLSYVRNELTQHTSVDRGASIQNTGSLNGGSLTVRGKSSTTGNGLLMGLSAGTVGVGVAAGIVNVKPTLNTTVGANGTGTTKLEKLDAVKVLNDASSKASASVLAVSANDTNATAGAANVAGRMNSFAIDGQLDASGSSDVLAVAAGGAAVGVNVNYVDVNSTNTARLDATSFTPTSAKKLSVTAGDATGKRTTSATTQSNTGTAGAIAVGVNVSIARNRAVNDAVITGRNLKAAEVALGSYGKGTANAIMSGVSAGGIKITASVVDALNETTNRARMNLTGKLDGSLLAESIVTGETTTKLTTGGGSLVGIDTNVATAYGKTNAVADVAIGGAPKGGSAISVKAGGRDTVTADIDNLIGLNAISVATMVGAAHAQDVYSAKAKLNYGDYNLSQISVTTDSDINAKSTVTPSSSGVNLAGVSVGVNVSTATSTAYAGAELALEGAKLAVEKDVDVKTTTSTKAEAIVKPAVFSWGIAIDVGVNNVESNLKGTQAAVLRLNNARITQANAVNVQSLVNLADSKATVSTSGADEKNKDRVKLGAISVDYNTAVAKESLASTAAIIGGAGSHLEEYQEEDGGEWVSQPTGKVKKVKAGVEYNPRGKTTAEKYKVIYEEIPLYKTVWVPNMVTKTRVVTDPFTAEDNRITANRLKVIADMAKANTSTTAKAYTQGAFQAGLLTVGNLDGQACTGETINAMFSGAFADIAGVAEITARGNTVASGTGTMPGALSLVNKGASNMKAGVGTQSSRQTVKALIGEGSVLNAGRIDVSADNTGDASAIVNRGVAVALKSVGESSQPTDSWYDTGVVIGNGAQLTATVDRDKGLTGQIIIESLARHGAVSTVSGTSVGVGLNLNTMMGQNTINDENNIDIGNSAMIRTVRPGKYVAGTGDIWIENYTSSSAKAHTDMTGGSFIEGTDVKATNTITRNARINVGQSASIISAGRINMMLNNGRGDSISTLAKVETDGGLALGNAEATTTLNSSTELHLAQGVNIQARNNINLTATGGSEGTDTKTPGVDTNAVVKAHGGGINPVAIAKTVLNVTTYIDINRRANDGTPQARTTIRSENGDIHAWANNDATHVRTQANADGKAAGGRSLAKTITILNLVNTVWVDDADLQAPNGEVLLEADNGDTSRALIEAHPYGELYAVGGSVSSDIEWGGVSINQIRTNDKSAVKTVGKFVHDIFHPISLTGGKGVRFSVTQNISRAAFTSINNSEVIGSLGSAYRCDFCGVADRRNVGIITEVLLNKRPAARTNTGNPFEKALSPLNDIQRMVDSVLGITKARYGEEDYAAAGKIFVLELPVLLEKDVTLDNEQILKYRLWNNTETGQDVILLPNSTRLYGNALGDKIALNYVSEVIKGDVRGDGGSYLIDIITALTAYAVNHPVIPIGSAGSLDFSTGTLTIPSRADFELYLHEVSGKWLIEKIEEGLIRRLDGDQDDINEATLKGRELPDGVIVEGLIDGGMQDGWQLYWLGDSPETAKDADQMLIGLLVSPETDEVDAFRISQSMIESGENPVDVSLYLYRDSKSDRMEEGKEPGEGRDRRSDGSQAGDAAFAEDRAARFRYRGR